MALSKPQTEILSALTREQLLEFIDMQQKNWWNLQNNWMAYMNAEYGMEAAVKGDCHCFPANARVQMLRLKKLLGLGADLDALMKAMVLSTIWANGEYDVTRVDDRTFRIRVTDCRQQVRRLEEGMGELACKPAGLAISEAAARVIHPGCQVRCLVCPPDAHPRDVWCEWEFALPG
ncbi:MAG: hypothetical protein A3F92_08650 [Candidatus Rokubacteria bacterium RIFCSPLOWO2_12_FULL_71_22]|nr:MAG: hypothetical protein A3F92_08650 [Candidatus Rokubacteria bacterium RIFCSPLOWO2_12_FULL_71_22]